MSKRVSDDESCDARRKHERLAQARAVASDKPTTVYRVVDDRGGSEEVRSTERAERLSRAGLRVTAVTRAEGQ